MKILKLNPKSSFKLVKGERELSEKDFEDIPKGLIPGEWFYIQEKNEISYIAYINLFAEVYYKIKVLKKINGKLNLSENEVAEKIIIENLDFAVSKRECFVNYSNGSRLVYGGADSLFGLIVDKYEKYIFIQINTAGIDRFRDLILKYFNEKFSNLKVVFYDNENYRKAEMLPIFNKESIDFDLEITENNLRYIVPNNILQKIGYYYDHRENRKKLLDLISNLNIEKNSGLDLFSYVGSWGLHLLKANVLNVDFIDQGNMSEAISLNLKQNGFSDRGKFIRSDVFKYLDVAIKEEKKYNIIVSDPPAFTKSEKNKQAALQGYEKLHNKAVKLLKDKSLFVVASCTHYVSHEELDKTFTDAALKNNFHPQLLDIGLQGYDHPMTSLNDKSFYIKYLVYFMNRG